MAGAHCESARTVAAPAGRPGRPRCKEAGRDRSARQREAARRDARPAQLHPAVVLLLRRIGRQDPGCGHPAGQEGLLQLHPVRAFGRRRSDHAVELAAAVDRVEARPGARRRLHRGAEAFRIHFRLDAGIRQVDRGGGIPVRCGERGHRLRQGSRYSACRAPAGEEDRLYGLGCHRPGDQRACREDLQTREPRAGRQVAQHCICRRQARGCGQRSRCRYFRRDRADLHRRFAPAAAGRHPRCVRRQAARPRADRADGRSDEPGYADRTRDHAAAVQESTRLHRHRPPGGRQTADGRRTCDASRVRQGLVRRAHHFRRRGQ